MHFFFRQSEHYLIFCINPCAEEILFACCTTINIITSICFTISPVITMINQHSIFWYYYQLSLGFLKFVDYGTSKDLLETDLNGPEFVGTPEYMCPGTVKVKSNAKVGIESDLWALGVTLFQMFMGYTAFAAPSPFLTFLRIKRAKVEVRETCFPPFINDIKVLL